MWQNMAVNHMWCECKQNSAIYRYCSMSTKTVRYVGNGAGTILKKKISTRYSIKETSPARLNKPERGSTGYALVRSSISMSYTNIFLAIQRGFKVLIPKFPQIPSFLWRRLVCAEADFFPTNRSRKMPKPYIFMFRGGLGVGKKGRFCAEFVIIWSSTANRKEGLHTNRPLKNKRSGKNL